VAVRAGRDRFGDSTVENLRANGVNTDLVVRSDAPTGCAVITVDRVDENAITAASGANMAASASALFAPDTVLVLQIAGS
jgi:ribokinase